MKKVFLTLSALFIFGAVSAQTDPKSTMPAHPVQTQPQKDTMTSNKQLKKDSDMKTMDAVKTQDHKKTTHKKTAKDSVSKKATRSRY